MLVEEAIVESVHPSRIECPEHLLDVLASDANVVGVPQRIAEGVNIFVMSATGEGKPLPNDLPREAGMLREKNFPPLNELIIGLSQTENWPIRPMTLYRNHCRAFVRVA